MAKLSKAEMSEIKKESDDLLKLILKKTGTSYNRLIDIAKQEFIVANIDVVTPQERQRFKHIVL
jgi:hypothetical protein